MLESLCSVKSRKLLQSTEAFCVSFPLLDFKNFTRWEPAGGNGNMYTKLLKGPRGILMFSCPNPINKIYTKQRKNIVQKQEDREGDMRRRLFEVRMML